MLNRIIPVVRPQCIRHIRRSLLLRPSSAYFSSKTSHWFRRFLSPKEEKELYLGITSSFREKLIEQGNKDTQTYSHIIEHAILSTKATQQGTLSTQRIEEIKAELDEAGRNKDVLRLEALEKEMTHAELRTVTIYNRLIRSYIASNRLDLAVSLVDRFDQIGILASTRSYTYLVKEFVKNNQLKKARQVVEQMQHLSLLKLRTGFDCSVMMKYYAACGDSHAIDYLWRDVMQYASVIKPGIGLYTQYLEHLLVKKDTKTIVQLMQDMLPKEIPPFTPYYYNTWMQAVQLLAPHNTQQAEQLLIYVLKKSFKIASWPTVKISISDIISSYASQDKELKALAFYYRLKKLEVPDVAFDDRNIKTIEHILHKSELRQGIDAEDENKALMSEFKGLLIKP